jgi:hypothetical protein
MKRFIDLLTDQGFIPADQVKDFGMEVEGVYYAVRKREAIYEYVSLMSYEGRFVEACYELFMAEKNTRKPKGMLKYSEMIKRGFSPLAASLPRSLHELAQVVQKTPEEVKAEADRLFAAVLAAEKADR